MKIEIRNKDGIMFGMITGKYAPFQYDNLCNRTDLFKRTTKNIVDKGTFIAFVCIVDCKMNIIPNNFDIWLEPGDYLKVV